MTGSSRTSPRRSTSPRRLSADPDCARRLLELVPQVPTPVWGRDELGAGEMWNSNSPISWLLARSGLDVESIPPPVGGRAPGWRAGIVIALRQQPEAAALGSQPRALEDAEKDVGAPESPRSADYGCFSTPRTMRVTRSTSWER